MSRSLSSLLLAAAIAAAVAALGAAGTPDPVLVANADDDTPPDPAPSEVTVLDPGGPTPQPSPDAAEVAQRDLQIAQAPPPAPVETPRASRHGTGELLAAAGTSHDPVDGGGRSVRFSVEVEAATGLDPDAVATIVEGALYDGRSWARDHDLQRVAPDRAAVRVVVATPATVDRFCARAELNTAGWLSCWNGRVAAINLDRWNQGVAHVDDLARYRRYVVNHEFGHGLGHGHVDCPGSGLLAPLMAQQTKSLEGCLANEWPFPDG